jgi:hypothetical protein
LCISEVLNGEKELQQEAAPTLFDAEHFVQLSSGYLYADPRQESNENRTREKVSEKAKSKDSGNKKDRGSHKRDETRELNISRCVCRERESCKSSRDHGCRCGIRTNNEMTRRAQEGERQHGQKESVEAGNDGRANDPGVAHNFRNAQRRECDASDNVWQKLCFIKWQ